MNNRKDFAELIVLLKDLIFTLACSCQDLKPSYCNLTYIKVTIPIQDKKDGFLQLYQDEGLYRLAQNLTLKLFDFYFLVKMVLRIFPLKEQNSILKLHAC